jgi:hypothetical protein
MRANLGGVPAATVHVVPFHSQASFEVLTPPSSMHAVVACGGGVPGDGALASPGPASAALFPASVPFVRACDGGAGDGGLVAAGPEAASTELLKLSMAASAIVEIELRRDASRDAPLARTTPVATAQNRCGGSGPTCATVDGMIATARGPVSPMR